MALSIDMLHLTNSIHIVPAPHQVDGEGSASNDLVLKSQGNSRSLLSYFTTGNHDRSGQPGTSRSALDSAQLLSSNHIHIELAQEDAG